MLKLVSLDFVPTEELTLPNNGNEIEETMLMSLRSRLYLR